MPTKISYQTIEGQLPELAETVAPEELGYALLRIFNGMSETRINRIKDGKDNLLKEENTFLVKKLLAFAYCTPETLLDRLEALKQNDKVQKNARLIVVSDGTNILGYDPKEQESYENTIDRLQYDYQFLMPLAGVERYVAPEERDADVKAAYKMARIFDEIRAYNKIDYTDTDTIHALNVFMSRLLFCFFAEDTGIFSDNLFTATLNDFTQRDGSDLSALISEAFDTMSTDNVAIRAGKPKHISQFPYVNGGLFKEHYDIPTLSWKARKLLIDCGELNWAEINPDIFGSMIQAVISPEMRSALGSHYTSVPNIKKLIQPLFLDELYAEFADARNNEKRLRQLLVRMGKIKFFDPACGSGNFLIITYKELRKLEIRIWEQLETLNHGMKEIPFSNISLTQFYGIEIEEFAHETTTLSLWLAEHQMNKQFENRFSAHIDALPLRQSGHITHGNACRVDWNTACPHRPEDEVYIMGNPPYMGARLQDESQKADMAFAMQNIRNYNNLDYITCWVYYGAKYIRNTKSRCAFVSTNSICQGEQVNLLWTPILKMDIEIQFAYTSFKWSNNAKYNAGVYCIIVGLADKAYIKNKKIYTENNIINATNISPYLVNANNTIVKSRSKPFFDVPEMVFGNMANDNGALFLSKNDAEKILSNYPESKDIIKKVIGSQEFIRGEERYCLWITDINKELALSIPEIKERILFCEKSRLKSTRKATQKLADVPWRFGEVRHKNTNSIIIPRVSSERRKYYPIGFLSNDCIVTDRAFVIYDAQLWLIGIISSNIHMVWMKAVAGRLKMDYNYSSTLCYNTFPFPKITEAKRTEIEQAAEAVLMAREMHTEQTLADMYDPARMPADLREAHTALDRVVESCYRPVPFVSDEERLEYLFALYEKMTKKK